MTRLLFVDDEARLLEGLRRMLRPHRGEWDMRFASSGAEALAMLAVAPADVVVSDMRMPGMDGAALLEKVAELHPAATRVILSGQFDTDAGLRLVSVAHQLLAKPCSPDDLRATIRQFSNPARFQLNELPRRVVGSIGSLPSPPRSYARLLDAARDPAVSIGALSAIVEQDAALAAKVLQLVNSAFFGLPSEVKDVRSAVAKLGIDLLRQLVLSAELARSFAPAAPIRGFSMESLAAHYNLTAAIAGAIRGRRPDGGMAVMCGLFHDVGKLVLASRMAGEFEAALALSARSARPLPECEAEIVGCSHADIGAHLLNLWGLPQEIVEAVATHHNPAAPPPGMDAPPLPALIHLANALAHEAAQPSPPAGPPARMDPALAAAFTADQIRGWRLCAREVADARVPAAAPPTAGGAHASR